ncbi:alpha/beta fold hydrolase [Pseudorhodobacter turbinis]|uniref:Alpha/beta fold hydrolase n=1 Tax=Pseudorhodobacter turbinis TaxID=2500533 RepID=A0A4V1E0I0_9RHOB|nr:alpha/beta fold hydrolase [Pseudorhodobacter turbinis]QCO54704.1 alpha/beta fold hydrolase [Pseudorhodobacter turbinis]
MDYDSDPTPFFLPGTSVGVLLLHGFTSTPQSIAYVGHKIHEATGATVSAPLLAGHGETPSALAQTGYKDWLASAEKALRSLNQSCDTTVVAGLSLGGTIALNLSVRFPELVDMVVSINGSTGIYNPEQVNALFADIPDGLQCGIGSDIKHPDRREICYDKIPAVTMRERFVLTCATGLMLPKLKQPILILQSRRDHVVAPENGMRIASAVGSTELTLRWLEESFHVATLDYDRDIIVEMIIRFITR